MKKLLLALSAFTFITAHAQTNCGNAVAVTDGTTTSTTVNGTYGNGCFGAGATNAGGTLKSIWYTYTPSANGLLTISSNVAGNTNDDTRLSIFTGTCGDLSCYAYNDDAASDNFLSEATFPVESGVTYYISWDNYWKATSFNFSATLTPSDCLSPGAFTMNAPSAITADSAHLSWDAAIGTPAGYDVDYGAAGHAAGTGTMASATTNSINLSSLDEPNMTYYVRSNCGTSQGQWSGPFPLYLAVSVPYSNGFDTAGNNLDGFSVPGWGIITGGSNSVFANIGDGVIYSNVSASTTMNTWAFTRAVAMEAGEHIGLTFYTWFVGENEDTASLNVTVGSTQAADGQSVIASYPAIEITGDYVERTAVYTAPAAGTYYFGFNNISAPGSATGYLFLDTVSMDNVILGTDDVTAPEFAVYPNPATDMLTIANATMLINNITIADLNGRTIKSMKFDDVSKAQVDLTGLSAGIYLMMVASDKGTVTKKIVKQ
jgi:hypothetical protein